jgi:type VI secretion system secreted protein Hcp
MKKILASLVLLSVLPFTGPAQADVVFLLKIDGVQGESKVPGFENEIDLAGFTASIFQSGLNYAPGTASAALAKMRTIGLTKRVDKSSGLLFVNCATGKHIPKVRLRCVYVNEPGAGPNGEFFTISLTDVLVAGVTHSGGNDRADGSELLETVNLSFSKIQFDYKVVTPNGTLAPGGSAGFDLKANVPVNAP